MLVLGLATGPKSAGIRPAAAGGRAQFDLAAADRRAVVVVVGGGRAAAAAAAVETAADDVSEDLTEVNVQQRIDDEIARETDRL